MQVMPKSTPTTMSGVQPSVIVGDRYQQQASSGRQGGAEGSLAFKNAELKLSGRAVHCHCQLSILMHQAEQ